MNFEEYLKSKKIDAPAFEKAEPVLYTSWKTEFSQMHPNSFTVQKLNLINPVRRKYQLKVAEPLPGITESIADTPPAKPAVARPMIKPKPKIN